MAGPDTPLPLVTLTAGNLDRARLEAIVAFPAAHSARHSANGGLALPLIGDQGVTIVQGLQGGPAGREPLLR